MASPRFLAASIAMERISLRLSCPVKSLSLVGRRAASNWRSPSSDAGETIPVSCMLSHQFQGFAEQRLKFGAGRGELRFAHGSIGGRALASEINQRGKHVLFDITQHR